MKNGKDDPVAQATSRERVDLVRKAIAQLSSSYREVVQLRDLEELSTKETAEQLGITPVNVRVRLHRARRALHKLLAPYIEERV